MSHPARKPHQANAIGHFDIAGPELAPLRAFYVAVFGWDVAERGPGYALVATPDGGPNGAIVEEAAASLTLGIVVPDLDGAIGLVGGVLTRYRKLAIAWLALTATLAATPGAPPCLRRPQGS